jgi:branched-chain amino acid aminotransferase group I
MLSQDSIVWFNGELKKFSDCSISLATHALHYGTSVFEGCRAYNGVIFKNKEHCERFVNSGEIVDVKVPYSVEELMQASNDVLKANNLQNAYVRPFAWKGDETLGVQSSKCNTNVAIMAWYWGSYYGEDKIKDGINLAQSDWVRPDPRSCAVQAKVGGNYYIGALNHNKIKPLNYDDVLMLDWRGYVAECAASNIFFVKDNQLFTPIADCFLNGITRKTMFEVANKMNLKCTEVRIKPEDLSSFDEAFVTGTAVEVMPVGSIFDQVFYKPNFSLKIREEYLKLVNI